MQTLWCLLPTTAFGLSLVLETPFTSIVSDYICRLRRFVLNVLFLRLVHDPHYLIRVYVCLLTRNPLPYFMADRLDLQYINIDVSISSPRSVMQLRPSTKSPTVSSRQVVSHRHDCLYINILPTSYLSFITLTYFSDLSTPAMYSRPLIIHSSFSPHPSPEEAFLNRGNLAHIDAAIQPCSCCTRD